MADVFFTSDLHFFHRNIIRYSNRPFADLAEMHKGLVERWNAKVPERDSVVYVLGDFGFAKTDFLRPLVQELNGRIKIVPGNHDDKHTLRELVAEGLIDVLPQYVELKQKGFKIPMCHFPLLSWNRSHYGAPHLHGHCHGTLEFNPAIKRLDVGIDARPQKDYVPWSWQEIVDTLELTNEPQNSSNERSASRHEQRPGN